MTKCLKITNIIKRTNDIKNTKKETVASSTRVLLQHNLFLEWHKKTWPAFCIWKSGTDSVWACLKLAKKQTQTSLFLRTSLSLFDPSKRSFLCCLTFHQRKPHNSPHHSDCKPGVEFVCNPHRDPSISRDLSCFSSYDDLKEWYFFYQTHSTLCPAVASDLYN